MAQLTTKKTTTKMMMTATKVFYQCKQVARARHCLVASFWSNSLYKFSFLSLFSNKFHLLTWCQPTKHFKVDNESEFNSVLGYVR